MFKTCCDKMMIRQLALAKNQANYKSEHQEKCEFEQKPMKNFVDLSDGEEEEIKKTCRKTKCYQTRES